jgi:hypothetical protein
MTNLEVANKRHGEFSDNDLRLLTLISREVAAGIHLFGKEKKIV